MAPNPAVKTCMDAFHDAFIRRHNRPAEAVAWLAMTPAERQDAPRDHMVLPTFKGAKDGSLMKQLIAAHGEAKVLRLIEDFFGRAYMDWGVQNSNQDVGAFYAAAPRLVVRDSVVSDRRTAENLTAAQRATEPGDR